MYRLAFLLLLVSIALAQNPSHPPTTPKPSPRIDVSGVDAQWSNFSDYLRRMLDTVETHWDRLRPEIRPAPKSGSSVTVKFTITEEGKISQIFSVTTATADTTALRTCVSALTDPAAYGTWTGQMKKQLGAKQEMVFTFIY